MSSGSLTSPGLGFNNTGKPRRDTVACRSAVGEPRGPGIYLAGLCITCGMATVTRSAGGLPQHVQEAAAGQHQCQGSAE